MVVNLKSRCNRRKSFVAVLCSMNPNFVSGRRIYLNHSFYQDCCYGEKAYIDMIIIQIYLDFAINMANIQNKIIFSVGDRKPESAESE